MAGDTDDVVELTNRRAVERALGPDPRAMAARLSAHDAQLAQLSELTAKVLGRLDGLQEEWRAAALKPPSPKSAPSQTPPPHGAGSTPLQWVQALTAAAGALAPVVAKALAPRQNPLAEMLPMFVDVMSSAGKARAMDRAFDLVDQAMPLIIARVSGMTPEATAQLAAEWGGHSEPTEPPEPDEG